MNIDTITGILNTAVQVTILGSLPSVGLGLLVGLFIAILQAVTQVQEQTITFVPKMIVVLLVAAATFPWVARIVMEMTLELWRNIPLYAR
ncbi:EscS/YscS/HrcS family type III secretion system export apparatus protein [bacterium]|nr:EscS/YscS/HrcS family type III secretion system export apparatus protein [bacterium]